VAAGLALSLTAPSLAKLSAQLTEADAAPCWRLSADRVLVDEAQPVGATGTRCAASRVGSWRWSGQDGRGTRYRWVEVVAPDGRPRPLRIEAVEGAFLDRLERELPGSRAAVMVHLKAITVALRGGRLRYRMHGQSIGTVPFRPRRG
jgi:hypothetical protein